MNKKLNNNGSTTTFLQVIVEATAATLTSEEEGLRDSLNSMGNLNLERQAEMTCPPIGDLV